ncbi:DUF4424 family protein [Bartonella sp. HY328]|uniref:DUF4424 family protein n=1 Tax=unclassified Bartonella TaxID=2645622 RepID=UPI0039659080
MNAVYSINAFAALGNEAGGLTLVNAEDIEVILQDFYVSVGLVKCTYIFKNVGKSDILTEVKLTLPEVNLFPGVEYSKPRDFLFFNNDVEIYPSFTRIKLNGSGGTVLTENIVALSK